MAEGEVQGQGEGQGQNRVYQMTNEQLLTHHISYRQTKTNIRRGFNFSGIHKNEAIEVLCTPS